MALFSDRNAVDFAENWNHPKSSKNIQVLMAQEEKSPLQPKQAQTQNPIPLINQWGMTVSQSQEELNHISDMNVSSPGKHFDKG